MSHNTNAGDQVDILLVEDNPGDVRLTKEAFKSGGICNELHVTTDGVAALDFLKQRGEYADAPRPAIVLLDLNLPRKNGTEVLREIRSDPDLEYLPVIILTSSSAEEDIVDSYEQRANAFLTKPVDPDEFADRIQLAVEFWVSTAVLPPAPE
jgi:CheY-like chemotaxis protein